jgi:hypothetical protein
MAIYQADQYIIPFSIRHKKEIVTPEMVSDVTIVIGDLVKRYSENALQFLDGQWLFPLKREETISGEQMAEFCPPIITTIQKVSYLAMLIA